MIRFFKKYKLFIIIFILIGLLVFSFFILKDYIYNDDLNMVYGNRLDNIEDYEITNDKKEEIIEKFSNDDLSFYIEIKGKIVNFVFDLKTDLELEEIDKIFKNILLEFEYEREFYDFQFLVENKETEYYLIGYINKDNDDITYSEYRKVDIDEEE